MIKTTIKLTKRQKQVLTYLKDGMTNKEIGAKLNLTSTYIQNILCRLFDKTSTKNKHHLIAWAYQNEIL